MTDFSASIAAITGAASKNFGMQLVGPVIASSADKGAPLVAPFGGVAGIVGGTFPGRGSQAIVASPSSALFGDALKWSASQTVFPARAPTAQQDNYQQRLSCLVKQLVVADKDGKDELLPYPVPYEIQLML